VGLTIAAMTTFALVHGAWHGAWCFDRVLPLLDAAGVPAVAVDLPGHGADPGPVTDLHGDADRVRSVLDTIDGDVVLLGHSYGGAVITEAGVHPAVRHVVYLCALALDQGEAGSRVAVEETKGISYEGRPNISDSIKDRGDGTADLGDEGVARCLYNGLDDETVAWAIEHLTPQPLANLQQEPRAVAWREKPSTYVVCTQDMAIHPEFQRVMAKRCSATLEWDTSHSPFASHPHLVADLLIELAK
jgi:pimeloyl-ACP methyl ester carboxylesterase